MNTVTLNVKGMSCMGCVRTVKGLVSALPGIDRVEVDLGSGRVEVTHNPDKTDLAAIRRVIIDGGYTIEGS